MLLTFESSEASSGKQQRDITLNWFSNTQTRLSSLICTSEAFVESMAMVIVKFHDRHADT